MKVSINQVKKLREKTNISVGDCKKALEKADSDFDKALEILKKKGAKMLEKKKERETKDGFVGAYQHQNGKIGALVKISCESDFVAKNEEFKNFCHEISMQVAAMNPKDINELILQPYIKDSSKLIKNLVEEMIASVGENIRIDDFKRIEI